MNASETDDEDVVYDLDPDCTIEDIESGVPYLATVNGVVDYGVFVDLSDDVSGLIHESALTSSPTVGEELIVELDDIRPNGDVAFVPAAVDSTRVESVSHEYEITAVGDLASVVGETVHLEGEVVQVRQTGGPTVFGIAAVDADGERSGIVPCAAFEAAGVRAYPSVSLDDQVRVTGRVGQRDGALQIEVEELAVLEGEAATECRQRLARAIESQAEPAAVDPLVDWPAIEPLLPDLRELARLLRRTVLEGRPIRIRHHADGDGMCAAVPVEYALRQFIETVHEDPDAPRHLLDRSPSKAPFYEMEDATRDLNFALEDRARHGQRLPLLLMLDNGSTAEDTPAYRNLAHYDIPVAVVDHHQPDPDAVASLIDIHVNPYLHGEDYRVTTGMLCVELARMVAPDITSDVRHVPAVAGIADRSDGEAMPQYLEMAADVGYDKTDLDDLVEALDYAAHWLRYDPGKELIADILAVDSAAESHHRELIETLAVRARNAVRDQVEVALAHTQTESLANGAALHLVDVENHARRFTYPAPGKTTGAVHDELLERNGGPAITIGYGPDFAVLRSDGVRLDIPGMVESLQADLPGAGVSGGGHLVVGSIKFVEGRRKAVLDALIEMMADAELDSDVATGSPLED